MYGADTAHRAYIILEEVNDEGQKNVCGTTAKESRKKRVAPVCEGVMHGKKPKPTAALPREGADGMKRESEPQLASHITHQSQSKSVHL